MKKIDPAALPSQTSARARTQVESSGDGDSSRVNSLVGRAHRHLEADDESDNSSGESSISRSTMNLKKNAANVSNQEDAATDIRENSNRYTQAGLGEADIEALPGSIPSNLSSGLKRRRALPSSPDSSKSDPQFEKGSYRNWRGNRDRNVGAVEIDTDSSKRTTATNIIADEPPPAAPGKRRRDISRGELLSGIDYMKVLSATENPSKRRGRFGLTDVLESVGGDDGVAFSGTSDAGTFQVIFPDQQDRGRSGHLGNGNKNRRNRGRSQNGVPIDESDTGFDQNTDLTGRADRVHYLAMVAAAAHESLRPPKLDPNRVMLPVGPNSRAECEKRCGSDGFCDPSSILGCGGEHCGRPYLDL